MVVDTKMIGNLGNGFVILNRSQSNLSFKLRAVFFLIFPIVSSSSQESDI